MIRNAWARSLFVCNILAPAWLLLGTHAWAEIPKPDDAPQPLSPQESVGHVRLPDGFRLELVAAEPLINEPSGVCWDFRGRMFVCELHGYNLDGQFDIDELNKTGKLDRIVRRIRASDEAIEKAKVGTYGTVKMLIDSDGDGVMDQAKVWADRLPPCYGICAARDGVIVACAPHIVYLGDPDGDGEPEVREELFTGLTSGILERGVNCPQWGFDNWIYVGRGHEGSRLRGPHLNGVVDIPNTDFRLKSDGTAIEPIVGGTGTVGHAMTQWGDRLVTITSKLLIVPPLPWDYLARNRDTSIPSLEYNSITRSIGIVYPISKPHPWRSKRSEDPGFADYYSKHSSPAEAAPNGYLTSCCSPLVYQDAILPGLQGQVLMCEPAQNFVHRAILERHSVRLTAVRTPEEQKSEFLASSDPWFHPIALTNCPDGALCIVDFYREIIEDYSAVPRYLQQQYGVVNGKDRGRIWRLVHRDMPKAPAAAMDNLSSQDLAREVTSDFQWRRETARRLLIDRQDISAARDVAKYLANPADSIKTINALYTLDGLNQLSSDILLTLLDHAESSVRIHALRLADHRFKSDPRLFAKVSQMLGERDNVVLLQLAMSLGNGDDDAQVVPALAQLARQTGEINWMPVAILSSLSNRCSAMLDELLVKGKQTPLQEASHVIEPICAAIGARHESQELSAALEAIAGYSNRSIQALALKGLRAQIKNPINVTLSEAAREGLQKLATMGDRRINGHGSALMALLRTESNDARQARLEKAIADLHNANAASGEGENAVEQIAGETDPELIGQLAKAFVGSTPPVQQAIVDALFSRRDRLGTVVAALESAQIPASALNAVQRQMLLEHSDPAIQKRAEAALRSASTFDPKAAEKYLAALKGKRDIAHGETVFREKCAACHQVRSIGHMVGPNLEAEFQRAEETYVKDILAPSETISPGYTTYNVVTESGTIVSGVLAAETPSSITVRQPGGKSQVILRKDIDPEVGLRASRVSTMPDSLSRELTPQDVADVIAWLRSPSTTLVLLDGGPSSMSVLTAGDGKAQVVEEASKSGGTAIRILPPGRHCAKIENWHYPIRKNPGPGQYRYLRFHWQAEGADGAMIELASDGLWGPSTSPQLRYFAGKSPAGHQGIQVATEAPQQWTTVTRDLWKDFGDTTLTGISFIPGDKPMLIGRVELLQADD